MAIQSTYQTPYFEILIWEIIEPPMYFVAELGLLDEEFLALQQIYKNPNALIQWLASRYSLQYLFKTNYKQFQKDENGKLFLKGGDYLSISHSNPYIAVAKSASALGIDIQIKNPKLHLIAHKYIASDLLEDLKTSEHYIDYLHLYWCIKEALFKAYSLGQVSFIAHLHIEPFAMQSEGWTEAKIIKPNFEGNYKVFYQKQEDYYLCVVTKLE